MTSCVQRLLLVVAIVFAIRSTSLGIPIVFLSDKGFGEGATVDSPTITVRPNEVNQIHVWVTTDIHTLVVVDLTLSQSVGGLEFLDAVVHEPTSEGFLGDHRWVTTRVIQESAESIGMLGYTGVTLGIPIGPAQEDVDALFDQEAGAFLFATVDYKSSRIGQTDLFLGLGPNAIQVAGNPIPFDVILGTGDEPVTIRPGSISRLPDATIVVVPEPQSVFLVSVALATLLGSHSARNGAHQARVTPSTTITLATLPRPLRFMER
jgi:hypothetical protein